MNSPKSSVRPYSMKFDKSQKWEDSELFWIFKRIGKFDSTAEIETNPDESISGSFFLSLDHHRIWDWTIWKPHISYRPSTRILNSSFEGIIYAHFLCNKHNNQYDSHMHTQHTLIWYLKLVKIFVWASILRAIRTIVLWNELYTIALPIYSIQFHYNYIFHTFSVWQSGRNLNLHIVTLMEIICDGHPKIWKIVFSRWFQIQIHCSCWNSISA